jgi:hypothetical protein
MKKVVMLILAVLLITSLTGCMRQAEKVSYNLSKEADQFNIQRRVSVFNARTDKPVLEIVGNLSVLQSNGDLDVIVEVAPNQYKKHFVNLNEWTIYVVEDVSGAYVDKYHYEINFQPEAIVPITFTNSD